MYLSYPIWTFQATDKTFEEKLKANLGKCSSFSRPITKTDKVYVPLSFFILRNCPIYHLSYITINIMNTNLQWNISQNAHFAIVHYAGTVSYNVTSWLEKNKVSITFWIYSPPSESILNDTMVKSLTTL